MTQSIYYNNESYPLEENETVLECLLRHDIEFPHACKTGICQSCMAKLTQGKMNSGWQKGLKETLSAQGYFLPCIAHPEEDIGLALPGLAETTTAATVMAIKQLNYNIFALRLTVSDLEKWIPGQYLNVINPNGDIRSYSIANVPEQDGYIELHIKIIPQGVMSQWVQNKARKEMWVHLRGPIGQCFYTNPKQESFPMVLAGTGTGLAPLIAIVREALRQGHPGEIHLIHGGCIVEDLYLDGLLKELALEHDNLIYESCVLAGDGEHQEASIDQVLLKGLQDCAQARVYVCGPEAMTKKLKTKAFLAGVASSHIYSDAFIS